MSGTGDRKKSSNKKAELYNPSSGSTCPVQDLHEDRRGHSSCGGLLCGSYFSDARRSCAKISGTEVSPLPSLTLRQERWGHLCWTRPDDKILLLGGRFSPTTTEIVSGTSSSGSFDLPYDTTSVLLSLLLIIITIITLQVCLWY